jgi:hypothetical protein
MAEVTPPHGQWKSPHPMGIGYLIEALKSIGCQQADIDRALQEAAVIRSQRYWDGEIGPKLQAALDGRYEVPAQPPRTEALLAFALFLGDSLTPLKEVVDTADFVYRLIPTSDEIAWALLRMRQRGWLAVQGNLYGLTAEGRRAIGEIVGEGSVLDRFERLEAWTLAHPPPGDE